MARAVLARAAEVVFISDYTRREVSGELGLGEIGSVIPFGAALDAYQAESGAGAEMRQVLGIPSSSYVILTLGRLAPVKRVDIAISALALLLENGIDAHLLIGGTGESDHVAFLQRYARDLDVCEQVHFEGYIPTGQVGRFFAAGDVFLFHSTFETFGVSLIEAMGAGLPVVCADATASAELIDDGKTGLLAKPLDTQDIASKLLYLWRTPQLRSMLSAQAETAVRQRYTWDRVTELYEQVLLKATVA
jgi:glycosyltransferase involved in cell wall biosynthesis